jgi:hypothetical protein
MPKDSQSNDQPEESSAASPEFIILIHGTGDARVPPQWWRPDSEFSKKLLERLGKNVLIWGSGLGEKAFNWHPAPNLESERRLASERTSASSIIPIRKK